MTPEMQKKILYAVGLALAAAGLELQHQGVLTGYWAYLPGALAWIGGLLKGKAMPAPGSNQQPSA